MTSIPIVRVLHPDPTYPFLEINESDFDPAKHERYIDPSAPPPAPALPPPPPAPADPLAGLGDDWRTRDDLRALAASVSGRAVENKKQAVEVIEAELAKRAAK